MVLELVAAGLTNKEIGEALCVSPHTARTHVERIADRLGIRNRTTMSAFALVRGLVSHERIEALWGVYHPELVESLWLRD